jgi:V/A-type H+-transporting ATPase subunit D
MIQSANRSRLFELRHDRVAASRSVELLERKREVLLHEIARRVAACDALRDDVSARYAAARERVHAAIVDAGRHAIGAAALAQEPRMSIARRSTSVMGVSLLQLEAEVEPFRASYGTAGTTASIDEAGRAYRELVADLIRLAEQEQAIARLRTAMRKTTRLLNALEKVLLPGIDREIHAIVEGLEEEERDAVRAQPRHCPGSALATDVPFCPLHSMNEPS